MYEEPPSIQEDYDYYLVSAASLLSLFSRCTECGSVQIEEGSLCSRTVGSALLLEWFCLTCDRRIKWSSQPMVHDYYEGNLRLTTAMHTTGVPRPVSTTVLPNISIENHLARIAMMKLQ